MSTLNVALVIENTEAEGPGRRYALWVQGCPIRCVGCCNPDMLPFTEKTRRTPEDIAREVLASGVEGISVLGGEPFEQAEGLAALARLVKSAGLSVMIFTGHTLEALRARNDPHTSALLSHTDLLVDGPYDQTKRTTGRRWVGSTNQTMHFLTDRYRPDDPVFSEPNHLEIKMKGGRITLNGWPVDGARTKVTNKLQGRTVLKRNEQ